MGNHEHGAVDHIVPIRVLVGTCLVLLFLTAVTVWVAQLDFNILNIPSMNLLVALAVASLKVFIVVMIFMHLRWDRSFIGFALTDTAENEPDIIPGNTPEVQTELDLLKTTPDPAAAHGGAADDHH